MTDDPLRNRLMVRGIRGAITAKENSEVEISKATNQLLTQIVKANKIDSNDVACIYFTTTSDLDSVYPAEEARRMGWSNVPIICAEEMNVANSLRSCVRTLVHWNTTKKQDEIIHVYLGEAAKLRPDLPFDLNKDY